MLNVCFHPHTRDAAEAQFPFLRTYVGGGSPWLDPEHTLPALTLSVLKGTTFRSLASQEKNWLHKLSEKGSLKK